MSQPVTLRTLLILFLLLLLHQGLVFSALKHHVTPETLWHTGVPSPHCENTQAYKGDIWNILAARIPQRLKPVAHEGVLSYAVNAPKLTRALAQTMNDGQGVNHGSSQRCQAPNQGSSVLSWQQLHLKSHWCSQRCPATFQYVCLRGNTCTWNLTIALSNVQSHSKVSFSSFRGNSNTWSPTDVLNYGHSHSNASFLSSWHYWPTLSSETPSNPSGWPYLSHDCLNASLSVAATSTAAARHRLNMTQTQDTSVQGHNNQRSPQTHWTKASALCWQFSG